MRWDRLRVAGSGRFPAAGQRVSPKGGSKPVRFSPVQTTARPHKPRLHDYSRKSPMNLLPKASGSRPRLACEISAGGVVVGRSPEPGLPLAAVARVELAPNAVAPGLKPGNLADRVAVIAAIRRALEQVGMRSNARNAELTLIIPDAAVRVSLLDFDALPAKLSEALPIVRFRLKKLVPFDADNAMISFQVMSTSRSMIRVLAVAVPRDVLSEYESAAREAGFEPGAVLPSTLAALAALEEGEGASLVVNAHPGGVTTAIVRGGILLLHRAIELGEFAAPVPANFPAALFESSAATGPALLPLVDRDTTEAEWAAQEPLPEHGRNPYADQIAAESANQDQDAITALPTPFAVGQGSPAVYDGGRSSDPYRVDLYAQAQTQKQEQEQAAVGRSPYASPGLQNELQAHFEETVTTPSLPYGFDQPSVPEGPAFAADGAYADEAEPPVHSLAPDAHAEEIARAVSVTVAYFEDSLSVMPEVLLSAGPMGADALNRLLREQGVAVEEGVRVRELVDSVALASGAISASVPRSWLAGVTGALKS